MAHNSKRDVKKQVVLGVDIGTTNIRCYAYNKFAKVIGSAQEKLHILEYEDGRHEIQPEKLWCAFQTVIKSCLLCSQLKAEDIACMGISTQRASFLTWDRLSNEPFHNFITWKDRRTEKLCDEWNSSMSMKVLRFGARFLYYFTRKTFFQVASVLKLTPSMVVTRLYWIIHNNKKIQEKISKNQVLFGTIDTWLVWKLTGGQIHATDSSNACVTGFFDIFKMQWMDWMLNVLNIPTNILPEVKNTSDAFGHSLPELFGSSIPICALVGDQQASMFGSSCFKKYDINCTMGTGSFLNMNTGLSPKVSINGVYPMVAWTISSETTYMVESCVHDVGTMLTLAQNLGLFKEPSDSSEMAKTVSGSDIFFLSSATLLEISGKNSTKNCAIVGLKSKTSKAHIVRCILESLGFQVYLLSDIMSSYGIGNAEIFRICGGVSKNDFILQFIADLLDKPVIRWKNYECSSVGAAFLAGLYCGIWKNLDEILSIQRKCETFYPIPIHTNEYRIRYKKWKYAIYHPIVAPSNL